MLKEVLFGNIGAKLMALSMAVVLWLYATGRHTGELSTSVPLEVLSPTGYTLLVQSATEVHVRLKGPKNSIDYVSELTRQGKIVARCAPSTEDKKEKDIIEEAVLLDKKNLNLPPEIKVDSIIPNKLRITLSRLEKKGLPVRLHKRGQPAPGYTLAEEFFYPFEVEVKGPASILKDATAIKTQPVDISNITPDQNRTFPWRVALEPKVTVERDGQTISAPVECQGEAKINVWFQIVEVLESKTFEKVRIKTLQPPDFPYNVKLQEESISLKVKGPKLILDKMTPPEVYVDVSGLEPPGPYKQPLRLSLPPKIELEGKLPELHLDILKEEVARK